MLYPKALSVGEQRVLRYWLSHKQKASDRVKTASGASVLDE